jgi:GTP-binding protein HflX
LPHELVASFHATLEETAQADLLLHVVDSTSPDRDQQMAAVEAVLQSIGASAAPQIVVWNKIDVSAANPGVMLDEHGKIVRVLLSAKTGVGLDFLREALAGIAREKVEHRTAAAA